ncbi:MAG TPA: hypothetical protein PK668_13475 [Myxococcota bacterium]|nr:hypothetical protein [Myxococcota bacterium]HRY94127.1 hypothetical protein [Myxococcota bacterium]HSA24659.1 hypothetical protein [Myxococcota bacterium]
MTSLPRRVLALLLCLSVCLAWPAGAAEPAAPAGKEAGSVRVYRFDELDVEGNVKAPQLLYFLKRIRTRFRSFRLPDPDLTRRTLETRDAPFL